jgi:hypothetical protein
VQGVEELVELGQLVREEHPGIAQALLGQPGQGGSSQWKQRGMEQGQE